MTKLLEALRLGTAFTDEVKTIVDWLGGDQPEDALIPVGVSRDWSPRLNLAVRSKTYRSMNPALVFYAADRQYTGEDHALINPYVMEETAAIMMAVREVVPAPIAWNGVGSDTFAVVLDTPVS